MLRPIDKLSKLVGSTGLVRMDRLRREADQIEASENNQKPYEHAVRDRRAHANLIEEIHRLSNPDFE